MKVNNRIWLRGTEAESEMQQNQGLKAMLLKSVFSGILWSFYLESSEFRAGTEKNIPSICHQHQQVVQETEGCLHSVLESSKLLC